MLQRKIGGVINKQRRCDLSKSEYVTMVDGDVRVGRCADQRLRSETTVSLGQRSQLLRQLQSAAFVKRSDQRNTSKPSTTPLTVVDSAQHWHGCILRLYVDQFDYCGTTAEVSARQ